jgi:hypothetical protein
MQILYSCVPASVAMMSVGTMLYSTPLTAPTIVFGFTSMMLTQLFTHQIDIKTVEKEQAPAWFLKFRTVNFAVYMMITSILFAIFYNRAKNIHFEKDPKRITNLRTVMELEDTEFI